MIGLVRRFGKALSKVRDTEVTSEMLTEVKKSQAASIHIQQKRYLSKERQKKYKSAGLNALLKEEGVSPSQKSLNKQLLKAHNIPMILNIYDNNRFYLSTYQVLTALSQFLRLIPSYIKQ